MVGCRRRVYRKRFIICFNAPFSQRCSRSPSRGASSNARTTTQTSKRGDGVSRKKASARRPPGPWGIIQCPRNTAVQLTRRWRVTRDSQRATPARAVGHHPMPSQRRSLASAAMACRERQPARNARQGRGASSNARTTTQSSKRGDGVSQKTASARRPPGSWGIIQCPRRDASSKRGDGVSLETATTRRPPDPMPKRRRSPAERCFTLRGPPLSAFRHPARVSSA